MQPRPLNHSRKLAEGFKALEAYYVIEAEFCNPDSGNESTIVPMELECLGGNKRKVWVNVYHSDKMSHNQNEQFYAKLDGFENQRKLVQTDYSAIQKNPLMKF